MAELDYDEADRLIRNCKTYNFGMWAADKLAHEVAPALLDSVRELEAERDTLDAAFDRDLPWRYDEAIARARDAEAERDAALSTIAKVRELHRRLNVVDDETDERLGETCEVCGEIEGYEVTWPCPTIRALGSVPSTGEGNDAKR